MIEKYSKFLVDSNIFIYHLNGEKVATKFLEANIDKIYISRITYIEVLSFNFENNEENYVIELLNLFRVIDTSDDIAMQCIKNRRVKKIKLADNIIASTVMVYDYTLVTRNTKDFNGLELKIINPFLQE